MFGNGNCIKKSTTDFTIDCILSKNEQKENGEELQILPISTNQQHSQQTSITLNKVLDNPWIPKCPLAFPFNPSSYQKKFPNYSTIPNFFEYPSTQLSISSPNFIQNLIKTTQHHTSVHSHFCSVSTSEINFSSRENIHSHPSNSAILPLDRKMLSLPKHKVYDKKKSCDTQILSENLNVVDEKVESLSPPITNELKCSTCFKIFENSELLNVHMKSHAAKPKFACSQCDKQFSQLRNFKYHMSIHRGTKEFAASCPECGKTFNDKGYLSSHLKIHRNKKEHECPYCPKSFNQRVAFNMHVRIHLGLKPHSCNECGKTFSRKMLLKQHYRTHSGEKPYQCSFEGCEKRFADRSNMILHFRLHSGIKPFSCTLCPKRFSKKHHLGTHLNYHLNLKPYSCLNEGCSQKFTQSSNMRTHMKKCPHLKS